MKRLLIEEWLPIAALGAESTREKQIALSGNVMAPHTYLHVWFARRPLVASRAAILGSLLPAAADREKFLHTLGIHGDPVSAKARMVKATADGIRLGIDVYGYTRAYGYTPDASELKWLRESAGSVVLLDPTAGGGSIPLEAVRLGLHAYANDLNPVAALILKATIEFPLSFGKTVLQRYKDLAQRFSERVRSRILWLYPKEPNAGKCDGYLWARTVTCPYCGGLVPLSATWALKGEGTGIRPLPNAQARRCDFEIVFGASEQSQGTVKDGAAGCPFSDCHRVIEGDEVKAQAQAGRMGHQLYAVVYRYETITGHTKSGKPKTKRARGYRTPRPEDDLDALIAEKFAEKMPEWRARNILPDEPIGDLSNYDRGHRLYGIHYWREMFSPRQLFGQCTSVEVFQELFAELQDQQGHVAEIDGAALCYVALALDKVVNYNSVASHWDPAREAVRGKFDRHDFSFKWSYGEMASTVPGIGYDWAITHTGKALEQLIELLGHTDQLTFDQGGPSGSVQVGCTSADALPLTAASVDCIVMDPPYYNNVMYAELSDFFYVWLKRTAGLVLPEFFSDPLTNKDREAVANVARFGGQKGSAELAGADYERRMGAIFAECQRVLKPGGVMTVMFTHKATGAWDALAGGLIKAGFIITASWPINTEIGRA